MFVKIKDICNITMGQSPESKYYSNTEGFPFLQGNRTFGLKYPFIDTYTTKITKKAKMGSILMSVRAPVGDLNIANQEICIGRGIASLEAIDGDNEFLYYALKSNMNNILNKGNGTTYDSITVDALKEIEINIPDTKQSREKISKILSGIDNQISRNNAMTKRLQVLGNTIYSRWFNQFNYPNNNKKRVFNKQLNKAIPKNWTVKSLSEIANLYQPQTITEKEIQENIGNYNVYGANGIIGKYHKYNHQDNEIAITCRGNSCGNMLMTLPFSWITGNSMVIGVTEDLKYKEYLYYYLTFTDLNRYITGSAQPQITANNLGMLNVLIPDNITLDLFEKVAKNIRKQIEELTYNTNELINLKEKLLPLLINGQLNI